jgi:hypothetical protein
MGKMEHARIGQILNKMVLLSNHDIEEILHEQNRNGRRFGQIALAWGLCRPEDVWEAWCRQLGDVGLQWVDLEELGIDARATTQLSRELAMKYRVVPMRCSEALLLAADEPAVECAMRELPAQCPRPLKFVLASSGDIQEAIQRYYPG